MEFDLLYALYVSLSCSLVTCWIYRVTTRLHEANVRSSLGYSLSPNNSLSFADAYLASRRTTGRRCRSG